MVASPPSNFFEVQVTQTTELALGIHGFELRLPDGSELPEFTPGAHIEVQTPSGLVRKYSLYNSALERERYQIAVKREPESRGGSASMVEQVSMGSKLLVSEPIQAFGLAPRAREHLLIAGGIGITPILAMARWLQETDAGRFKLIYCTRNAESTAFLDELSQPEWQGLVTFHHDAGDPEQALDLWPWLETPKARHVYCCGPRGLMDAVRDMSGHWPTSSVHFESFGAENRDTRNNTAFTVHLARSGKTLVVDANQSILDAVRDQGVSVPSSCESGTCGSCRIRLLEGTAEHRDMVLLPEEQDEQIMVCVSRARSDSLTLDL